MTPRIGQCDAWQSLTRSNGPYLERATRHWLPRGYLKTIEYTTRLLLYQTSSKIMAPATASCGVQVKPLSIREYSSKPLAWPSEITLVLHKWAIGRGMWDARQLPHGLQGKQIVWDWAGPSRLCISIYPSASVTPKELSNVSMASLASPSEHQWLL